MKKLLIAWAFACVAVTGFAQETEPDDPTLKYSVATNSFWSNWFIQLGAEWNAWYSDEEHGRNLSASPFKGFRSNPGIGLAVGKWFTPGIGLRTKLQGIWGKTVTNGSDYGSGNKYWLLSEDVMLNLSNLFCGYSPTRVWNMIAFGGAGVGRSMTYDQYAGNLRWGLQSQWKVSRHVSIYLEGGWNCLEPKGDGVAGVGRDGWWDSHDNNLYAELGVSFQLGRASWDKTPDVDALKALSQSQIDALNAQLDDANAENARLKALLVKQKPAETVKELVGTPVSVFFNINKSKPASRKDLVDIKALADYAKVNDARLEVTGYADSATGSAEYNQKLSEERAGAVADELVKMGVDRSRITVLGKGGVDGLSPVSFNRRATVRVAE